jgi:hypothetical protein
VSHNYSMPTIKTLFGQALHCAYPGCAEPLIFEDRDAKTVVAEIAHIRSEMTNGPRYDAAYTGHIDGPDNLLLLCGKHHAPVDRHESIYPTTELLEWKRRQVETAGSGTPISTTEARRFTLLTQQELDAMRDIARLTTRVERACARGRDNLNQIESDRRRALEQMRQQWGPAYAVNSDGSDVLDDGGRKVNLAGSMQMSAVDAAEWQKRADQAFRAALPAIEAATDQLDEQIGVLRMMNTPLAVAANRALLAAAGVGQALANEDAMELLIGNMHAAVRDMWLEANPDT